MAKPWTEERLRAAIEQHPNHLEWHGAHARYIADFLAPHGHTFTVPILLREDYQWHAEIAVALRDVAGSLPHFAPPPFPTAASHARRCEWELDMVGLIRDAGSR
jgi:hypothetical protein